MGGGSSTSGPSFSPEERLREFKRQRIAVPLVIGVVLAGIVAFWRQVPVATVLFLVALIVVMLVFLWRQYRAVKADEAYAEYRGKYY